MPNIAESLQMCMWFDVNVISRRNLLSSIVSSLLVGWLIVHDVLWCSIHIASLWHFQFFLAWWVVIGIAATSEKGNTPDFSYYICGILGTISFVMVNSKSHPAAALNPVTQYFLPHYSRIKRYAQRYWIWRRNLWQ